MILRPRSIQRAQNNDSQALHLKLNELIAATPGASSRLLNIEDISEHHQVLHSHHAKRYHDLTKSHSIEKANRRHSKKSGMGKEE